MNDSSFVGSATEMTVAVLVHDGEAFLKQTLEHLAAQSDLDDVRIIVICNGCNDRSAEVARKAAKLFDKARTRYEVLELPRGSRAEALNGMRQLYRGALVIVDQDAVLSPHALSAVRTAFRRGYCFATLLPSVERSRSLLVRAYYRFWMCLRYVQDSPATMGFYAISNRGLLRISEFPPVYSDDKFARLHFHLSERVRIESEWYRVRPQNDVFSLVRDRARYNRSSREIARLLAIDAQQDVPRRLGNEVAGFWIRPSDGVVFAAVIVLSIAYEWLDRAWNAMRN